MSSTNNNQKAKEEPEPKRVKTEPGHDDPNRESTSSPLPVDPLRSPSLAPEDHESKRGLSDEYLLVDKETMAPVVNSMTRTADILRTFNALMRGLEPDRPRDTLALKELLALSTLIYMKCEEHKSLQPIRLFLFDIKKSLTGKDTFSLLDANVFNAVNSKLPPSMKIQFSSDNFFTNYQLLIIGCVSTSMQLRVNIVNALRLDFDQNARQFGEIEESFRTHTRRIAISTVKSVLGFFYAAPTNMIPFLSDLRDVLEVLDATKGAYAAFRGN